MSAMGLEFFDYYMLSITMIMVIIVTYVGNRATNQGKINKKTLLTTILIAPIPILTAYLLGKFFNGNGKFLLIIVPCIGLLVLQIKPRCLDQYNPFVNKYAGVIMAVLLCFLIAGCGNSDNDKVKTSEKNDVYKKERYTESPTPTKRGTGMIR
jgi:amino acid permease